MIKEWNILVLESMLKNEDLTPLRRYFIWEALNNLKKSCKIVKK